MLKDEESAVIEAAFVVDPENRDMTGHMLNVNDVRRSRESTAEVQTGLHRPSQPLFKRDDRLIAEDPADPLQAGQRVADVAGPGRLELGLEIRPEDPVQGSDQVEEPDPLAGPDVEDLSAQRLRMPHRGEVGGHGIGHIGEVAGLLAVAEDGRPPALGTSP